MTNTMFDYFYGIEADQFTFFRIPKLLITHSRFSSLSTDAKLLYGLLLDRMSLSIKNEWIDENDRVYIIYSIESISFDLNCGKNKAVRVLKELDSENGIGLVDKKRLGLGKPNVMYVKNFNSIMADIQNDTETLKSSRIPKSKLQEYPKVNFKNTQNQTSRIPKSKLQEHPKVNPNKTNNNKTNISKNDMSKDTQINQSIKTFLDRWNGLPDPIIKINKLAAIEIRKLNLLTSKNGLENVLLGVDKIKKSEFLTGRIEEKPFVISLAWFLNQKNLENILEDKYTDYNKQNIIKSEVYNPTSSIASIARQRRLSRIKAENV